MSSTQTTVTIQDETYAIESVTDMSLYHLMVFLQNGSSSTIEIKSNVAAEIKEAIIPTLPDSIISVNRNGKYIFHISAEEINKLICEVTLAGYEYKIKRFAQKDQSKINNEELAEAMEMVKNLSEYLESLNPSPKEVEAPLPEQQVEVQLIAQVPELVQPTSPQISAQALPQVAPQPSVQAPVA